MRESRRYGEIERDRDGKSQRERERSMYACVGLVSFGVVAKQAPVLERLQFTV